MDERYFLVSKVIWYAVVKNLAGSDKGLLL